MKKINIAELLKDCPKGMELDCVIYDNVEFEGISNNKDWPIAISVEGYPEVLNPYGCISYRDYTKCVIFPKGKTTWEGFVPPCEFKDGDIVYIKTNAFEYIFIFKVNKDDRFIKGYATLSNSSLYVDGHPICEADDVKEIRLATDTERTKLFDAIKAKGYRWNTETKTLEKLVEPQFNVGDWIIRNNKYTGIPVKVIEFNGYYSCELNGEVVNLTLNDVHNNFHLWTIQDAIDGDVLVDKDNNIGIFQKFEGIYWYSYIYLGCDGELRGFSIGGSHKQTDVHPATKEQCDLLFQKIKEAGYTWNTETKTLEKLIQSKFKVGDKVRYKNNHNVVFTITNIEEDYYACGTNKAFWFTEQDDYELIHEPKFKVGDRIRKKGDKTATFTISDIGDLCYYCGEYVICNICYQDDYELVPNKFDINTLKPLQPVLVRDSNIGRWDITFYEFYDSINKIYPYHTLGGCIYKQCIPYEENEYLLGKTDDCKDFYKTW